MNLNLAIGKFTSGIGVNNMAALLSFLDISNTRSLKSRFFKNIEAIIGKHLRKVVIELMKQATDTEVKMTLKNEKNGKQYENKNLPVGVTVSVCMGWNKHLFGNIHDSVSSHVLMIEYLSKKILLGLFLVRYALFVQRRNKILKSHSSTSPPKILRAL